MIIIFLNADLEKIEEAVGIEDETKEYRNIKSNLNGRLCAQLQKVYRFVSRDWSNYFFNSIYIPTIEESSVKERRLYKRHTAGLSSRLESITSSGTEKIYHLETKDLSMGGAFIYIKDSSYFPQETRFIMDITIPKDRIKELTVVKSLLEGTGTVVRSTLEGIAIQCDTKYEIMNIRGA